MSMIVALIILCTVMYTISSIFDFFTLTTKRNRLRQKVLREQEALRKELDELDKQAFKAYNDLLKESMNIAKEDYKRQRDEFTPPVSPNRKDAKTL